MKFEAHAYQKYDILRVINAEALALFLEMGLGKTVITLTAVNDLRYNRLAINRCLIIAPKKVAEATWTDEAARWDHLKHLRLNLVLGATQKRIRALNTPGDIWVINRENVPWLVDYYKNKWPFDMIVIDELSSFKNPSAKRFRALKLVRGKIKRVIGLTGTPAPNGYTDLWSQIYLLDQGARLEKTITAYRAKYFDHNPYRHTYELKPGADKIIDEKIRDLCISMKAEDYLALPDCVIHDIPVKLDPKAQKAYDDFEREAVLQVIEEEETKGFISASSAAVLTGKLLQFCGGAVYDDQQKVIPVNSCKMEALEELIESLEGEPVLIFYQFKHERERLLRRFQSKFKSLRVSELKGPDEQRAWNQHEIDVLLAHPASAAYGLNLQQGGHHIIWYTLNWSLELYQQANARLHRQGQGKPVIIHRLLVKGGRDEDVAAALADKKDTQESLMRSLRARIEKIKGSGQ